MSGSEGRPDPCSIFDPVTKRWIAYHCGGHDDEEHFNGHQRPPPPPPSPPSPPGGQVKLSGKCLSTNSNILTFAGAATFYIFLCRFHGGGICFWATTTITRWGSIAFWRVGQQSLWMQNTSKTYIIFYQRRPMLCLGSTQRNICACGMLMVGVKEALSTPVTN
jgi:hypothetical protein